MFQDLRLDDSRVLELPVYVDTSWPPSLATPAPERVRAVVEKHGADRVVFASTGRGPIRASRSR